MKELNEYREKLIARLGEAADEFCGECRAFTDPFKVVEGKWTLHQIASHVRVVDREVYSTRIRRTLAEENPEFKVFDPDAWMAEQYRREEPLDGILDAFSENVKDLCAGLHHLPREAWSRESRHAHQGGGLTLQLWVERNLAHVEEHLRAVKRAKNG
ncbi:MAG TPA: DinB family protein [Anaerolineales bacterium]|nr:DinB family protein [Anaerolineales bacterium]